MQTRRAAFTYHVASSVVLPTHLLPLTQIILQQVPDLRDSTGVAVSVTILMTHWVAVPIGAIVTAVTIVMWHSYSPRVILAVMAVAVEPSATLQLAAVFLVVSGDIIRTSAGLNFVV